MWHILGAGAIGLRWARKLVQAGESVELIFRDQTAIRAFRQHQNTVIYRSQTGEEQLKFNARSIDNPDFRVDNLLICTKSHAIQAAYQQIRTLLQPDAQLILLCNGYGPQQQIAQSSDPFAVWAASTTDAANLSSRFIVNLAGSGQTLIGPMNEKAALTSTPLLNLERHAYTQAIDAALWRKLAINACINPLTLIYQVKNGELVSQPSLYLKMKTLAEETERLSAQLGKPLFEQPLISVVTEVCRQTSDNISSMLQDYQAARTTEIDQINGSLIRIAQQTGIELPQHQRLLARIKDLLVT